MKILDSDNPIADACAYAKSSQKHGESVSISLSRGIVIVRHANGHVRGYRKPDGVVIMNRVLASLEVEGFDQLAKKGASDARS